MAPDEVRDLRLARGLHDGELRAARVDHKCVGPDDERKFRNGLENHVDRRRQHDNR
jgi:hypothetical protein